MAYQESAVNNDLSQGSKDKPLAQINSLFDGQLVLDDMENVKNPEHIFMIKPFKYDPNNPNRKPEILYMNDRYEDIWDDDHVRMPCSAFNTTINGKQRWPLIQKALIKLKEKCEKQCATVADIKLAIEEGNEFEFDTGCLENLLCKTCSTDGRNYILSVVLPRMISLALNIDKIFGKPPKLLRMDSNRSVTMSQHQAGALLVCGFFCLFPYEFNEKANHNQRTYQSLNFHYLLSNGSPWKLEKLKCIFYYFERITEHMPNGVLTFQRRAFNMDRVPKWLESQSPLCDIHLVSDKTIEDMHGFLQVDFANEFVGGGVMNEGIVQEEIRFTICPEMLISILLCEVMNVNECIFLIGCEQYATYTGYATTFRAKSSFHDETPKDSWGRKLSHVVAMDAICYLNPLTQYTINNMVRELIKSYTSFRTIKSFHNKAYGVATGKWGCGAFNGDPQLKAIIQLIASSEAGRPLIFVTWHDQSLFSSLGTIYDYLKQQQATVRDLCQYLQKYSESKQYERISLFEYIFITPIHKLREVV